MNPGRLIEELSKLYCSALLSYGSAAVVPSVMLWGPPGVGKSQGVRQIAKEIEKETGKTVKITDVRLLLFNPIDLRGIPTANADKTLAIWLKPQIFQMDDSDDIVNILFLDEISAAPQSVQAAAYQITLDRVVGEHKLPDNCIVIAAGNRVTDKSVSFKMPKALANRLLHIEIEGSFDSWLNWAEKSGINQKVIGFLSFRTDKLFGFDAKKRVCIISEKEAEIREFIVNELHSGATLYQAIGAYNEQPRREIITIVDKNEYIRLMSFIEKTDSNAFITVYAVHKIIYRPKVKPE